MNLDFAGDLSAGLKRVFSPMHEARDARGGLDYRERMDALAKLGALLRANTPALCEALDADFRGRASQETRILEIFPALSGIAHARRSLKRWMRPQRRPIQP